MTKHVRTSSLGCRDSCPESSIPLKTGLCEELSSPAFCHQLHRNLTTCSQTWTVLHHLHSGPDPPGCSRLTSRVTFSVQPTGRVGSSFPEVLEICNNLWGALQSPCLNTDTEKVAGGFAAFHACSPPNGCRSFKFLIENSSNRFFKTQQTRGAWMAPSVEHQFLVFTISGS